MMKLIRRILLVFLCLGIAVLIFRGPLYRLSVAYKPIGARALIHIENESVIAELDAWLAAHPSASTEQIIGFALEYSTKEISYTFGRCTTNPNEVLKHRKYTNCVGYSAALHAVISYLIDKKQLESQLSSEHKVAHLYFLGYNVHPYFSDPSFKDHDYNVITDRSSGKKYVMDPTLEAVFGISHVAEKAPQ